MIEPDYGYFLNLEIWTIDQAAFVLCRLSPDPFRNPNYRLNREQQGARGIIRERSADAEKLRNILATGMKTGRLQKFDGRPPIDSITSRMTFEGRPTDIVRFAFDKGYEIPEELKSLLKPKERSPEEEKLVGEIETLKAEIKRHEENPFAFDTDEKNYAEELDIAVTAWQRFKNQPSSTKADMALWIKKNWPNLSRSQTSRITTVINPRKSGGRRPAKEK